MNYACPAWEFVAGSCLLKLQHLQNKVLRTTGNFPKRTPNRDLHVALKIPKFMTLLQNYAGSKKSHTKS
jgi:hypothetical protein